MLSAGKEKKESLNKHRMVYVNNFCNNTLSGFLQKVKWNKHSSLLKIAQFVPFFFSVLNMETVL